MHPLDRGTALLAGTPLVDGHNDLPWALREPAGPDPAAAALATDLAAGAPTLPTDLPRLRAGHVGMQFWSVYVPCSLRGADAVPAVLEQVELVRRLTERYPELALATTADAAEAAFAAGRIASLLGAEGGHATCCGCSGPPSTRPQWADHASGPTSTSSAAPACRRATEIASTRGRMWAIPRRSSPAAHRSRMSVEVVEKK